MQAENSVQWQEACGMKAALRRFLERFDGYQQRHSWLSFPIAVVRKFDEDQASNLAALLAYYAFFSFFPLMLVLVTTLGLVVSDHPKIAEKVQDSVLSQFPVIGDQLQGTQQLRGSALALAIGLGAALWAGLALANAAQSALNTVWQVPLFARPSIVTRTLRSLALILVLGLAIALATATNAFVAGARSYGSGIGTGARILAVALAFAVNVAVFAAAFRVLTDRRVSTQDVLPGAVLAAVGWQILQLVGGYLLAERIKGASHTYGTFAVVIGVLTWFYLQAQLTLFAAELNVVRRERLWPRSVLAPPPATAADERSYHGYAELTRVHPDEKVETRFE
jgi:membrane protein